MSQYEMSGSGIQFNNWAKNYDPNEEMTFLTSMIMMLVDAAFYMTLTWYLFYCTSKFFDEGRGLTVEIEGIFFCYPLRLDI